MLQSDALVESLCHGLVYSGNLAADSKMIKDRVLTAARISVFIPMILLVGLTAGAALAETAPICALRQQIIEGKAARPGAYALFTGPRGTGKTMAGEVLAHSMKMDLFRVDLSMVIGKYIGETEKNLDKIFNSAAKSGVVLFFDEADALFGKRTETKDSHDLYSNAETDYLLKRIETHEGIVILATNQTNPAILRNRKSPMVIKFAPGHPNPRDQLKNCK